MTAAMTTDTTRFVSLTLVRALMLGSIATLPLAGLRAQTSHVIGWADNGPRTVSEVHRQDVLGKTCLAAVKSCATTLQSATFTPFAGGTAYDGPRDAAWNSDGKNLELVDLTSCKTLCVAKAQLMNSSALVSGLATYDGGRRLMQLETSPGYAGLRSYDVTQCPPVPLRDGCTLKIPQYAQCAGLAIDAGRDLVWVCVTLPGVISSRNFLRVSKLSSKCQELCEIEIPICGPPLISSQVLGLAFDMCTDRLFATYGLWTLPIRVVDPTNCKLVFEPCCEKRLGGTWRGLAVRSTASASHYGKACIGKGCAFCSNLSARPVGGLPTLGNTNFGFHLEKAPVPSHALLIVGAGRCTKGIGVPFLCGAIYPSLQSPTFFLGPVAVTGSGQCDGSAQAILPIPADLKLCGAEICLQWIIICGPLSGFGSSDTWEFRIG